MEKNKINKVPNDVIYYINSYIIIRFILIVLLSFLFFKINFDFVRSIISLSLIFTLISLISSNWSLSNISFSVNDNELIYNYGIFVKHSQRIILSQIQNINVGQGILEQVFKIKSIKIWTSSSEQFNSTKRGIITSPILYIRLKEEDIDNFRSLLNKP